MREGERGFTLIEFLIAITIAGFILASLATATRVFGRSWIANTESLLRQDMFLRGLDIVARDVQGMQRLRIDNGRDDGNRAATTTGTEPRKTRGDAYIFAGTAARMELVVVEPPYPTRPGLFFVRYSVVPERDGFALLRERAPYDPRALSGDRREKIAYRDGVILLEGRYRFSFSYASAGRDDLVWSQTWSEPEDMPKMVRLEVMNLDSGRPVIPPLALRPRIDAEHDCIKPKSQKCSVKTGDTGTDAAAADASGNQPPAANANAGAAGAARAGRATTAGGTARGAAR